MRKFLALLLVSIFIIALFPTISLAAVSSDGLWEYKENSDGTVTITAFKSNMITDIVIPAEIDGKTVSALEGSNYRLFYGKENITSVRIDAQIPVIQSSLFDGCSNLKSVTLPQSLTAIKYDAFLRCEKLTNINLPPNLKEIGPQTFAYTGIGSVEIPVGVTEIGWNTFYGCKNLSSVKLHPGVTAIGKNAFTGCVRLTSIAIPDGVTYIGKYAFSDCPNLRDVNIPTGLSELEEGVFYGCGIKSITVPGNVKTIWSAAFFWCDELESIDIQEGITNIYGEPFGNCTSLERITIPNSVTNMDDSAFYKDEKFIIYCWPGSTAQSYADKNKFPYVLHGTNKVINPRPEKPSAKPSGDSSLKAPNGLTVKKLSANKAVISWSAVSGAKGYELFYSVNGGAYSVLKVIGTKSYTHSGLKAGSTYSYKVRAYKVENGKKVYGAFSKAYSLKDVTGPIAVKKVKAISVKTGTSKVTWAKVSGAAGYEVQVSTDKTHFKKAPSGDVRSTSYTRAKLIKGKTYYYRVRAYKIVSGKRTYGPFSAVASVKIK